MSSFRSSKQWKPLRSLINGSTKSRAVLVLLNSKWPRTGTAVLIDQAMKTLVPARPPAELPSLTPRKREDPRSASWLSDGFAPAAVRSHSGVPFVNSEETGRSSEMERAQERIIRFKVSRLEEATLQLLATHDEQVELKAQFPSLYRERTHVAALTFLIQCVFIGVERLLEQVLDVADASALVKGDSWSRSHSLASSPTLAGLRLSTRQRRS